MENLFYLVGGELAKEITYRDQGSKQGIRTTQKLCVDLQARCTTLGILHCFYLKQAYHTHAVPECVFAGDQRKAGLFLLVI